VSALYDEITRKHRRLTILRGLADDPHQGLNESILHDLIELRGVPLTRDQVKTEIGWLREQGFLRSEDLGGHLICFITPDGMEVATGRRRHDGVKFPSVK